MSPDRTKRNNHPWRDEMNTNHPNDSKPAFESPEWESMYYRLAYEVR